MLEDILTDAMRSEPFLVVCIIVLAIIGLCAFVYGLYFLGRVRRLLMVAIFSILFGFPVALIVLNALAVQTTQIELVGQQQKGIRHHGMLMKLLRAMQDMRATVYLLGTGGATVRERLVVKRQTVRQVMAEIDKAREYLDVANSYGAAWEETKKRIDILLLGNDTTPYHNRIAYVHAVELLLQMMDQVSGSATIMIDSQQEINRSAVTAMSMVPKIVVTLGKVRIASVGLLAAMHASSDETIKELERLYATLDYLNGQMEGSIHKATAVDDGWAIYDQLYHAQVEPKLRAIESRFIRDVNSLPPASVFYMEGTEAINAYHVYYENIAKGFAQMLEQYREKYVFQHDFIFYSSLLALAGFVGLFGFLYYGLTRTENAERNAVQMRNALSRQHGEMHRQKALLDTLLNNMPLAILAKDASKNFEWLMLNRMAEKILGFKESEVLGCIDYELYPREQADFFHKTDVRVMKQGQMVEIEAEPVDTPTGTIIAHTIKVPIYNETGEPSILLGIIEDVTQKIGFMEELRVAKEQAESANVAKSEFLANMSHELRTPLNSIIGMNRLLMQTDLQAEQRDLADAVFRSSSNLLEIVNDILDLSKIEAGEMQLEKIGFDLAYIFDGVIHALQPLAMEKRIVLGAHFKRDDFPFMIGDPLRVTSVITNLVSNAIKYTESGNVDLRASCRVVGDDQVEVRCEIIDTGIGIPPDKLEAIFEKFGQADNSMTRRYGGTGLGLAITRQLVELMGGKIGVASKMGQGSTFWISIPFGVTAHLSPQSHSNRKRTQTGNLSIENARVLIAEDHPANQILIGRLMQKFGVGYYDIAEDGGQLMERYRDGEWDVILLDCHMPVMSGYDAVVEIRKLEKESGRHTPVVAMTANAMVGEREKCLRLGMDDYISKPINQDEFRDILGQWLVLGGKKTDAPNTASPPATAVRQEEIPSEKPKQEALILDKSIVDLSLMREVSEGDQAMERKLVSVFIRQTDINMVILRDKVAAGTTREWINAAHMVKGGAGGVGAMRLHKLAETAQEFEGDDTTRAALLAQMETAYADVKIFFKKAALLD